MARDIFTRNLRNLAPGQHTRQLIEEHINAMLLEHNLRIQGYLHFLSTGEVVPHLEGDGRLPFLRASTNPEWQRSRLEKEFIPDIDLAGMSNQHLLGRYAYVLRRLDAFYNPDCAVL
ncbi:hypothetical protein F6X40_35305 [Paraburkholderia sp. UCT31]|uniref:hypothetical protein n=1 Tax=Paraburkholderia sp. UCT31 TaxID=2615209 RepID=UPI00165546F5|nr:hypothetical protein [Paraburkholderia sp. UCT31]MBC8741818.1 hypothetical protein [Paraburkholderia sp. UCT31]